MNAPFTCPQCGESDWIAWYKCYESQTCTVIVGDNGEPEVEDYTGCTDWGESGDTEEIRCGRCDHFIILAGPDPLDEIHALLDGKAWSADTIESVAEIIRGTGRKIGGPA